MYQADTYYSFIFFLVGGPYSFQAYKGGWAL